jgi:hypothetical protein
MLDTSTLIPLTKLQSAEVVELSRRAELFLTKQKWCKAITDSYLGWALSPYIGVFYFQFDPITAQVDKELWVIVGDLPPAYIVCDQAKNWQQALDAYGVEMMNWVQAVREGNDISKVIPVNVEPTLEYADMLESRIHAIWEGFVDVPPETLPSDL